MSYHAHDAISTYFSGWCQQQNMLTWSWDHWVHWDKIYFHTTKYDCGKTTFVFFADFLKYFAVIGTWLWATLGPRLNCLLRKGNNVSLPEWKEINSTFYAEMMKDPFVAEKAAGIEPLAIYTVAYMDYLRNVHNSDRTWGSNFCLQHMAREESSGVHSISSCRCSGHCLQT